MAKKFTPEEIAVMESIYQGQSHSTPIQNQQLAQQFGKTPKTIASIKIIAPRVALKVIDRAIQAHGGAGVCQDFDLAAMYAGVNLNLDFFQNYELF